MRTLEGSSVEGKNILFKKMLASDGAFPIPLPTDISQLILSFVPPVWTELSRETIVTREGYLCLVPSHAQCFESPRVFLLNPQYSDQCLKYIWKSNLYFSLLEADEFLKYMGRDIPEQLTIGHLFPLGASREEGKKLLRFNVQLHGSYIRSWADAGF